MKTMTVGELIEELQKHPNKDAEVRIEAELCSWSWNGRKTSTVKTGTVINAKQQVNSILLETGEVRI